ncbi:ferric reductase-like transmembrane domain-containing protein [Micromonospora sp. HUAS LYJ1]|uniref:ferric reductase-like transmembrane domain-containing protein n=1 Tax=Micromonospora sp. HUAS LYJ1 TaxID=3061626 RepID=UPI0026714FE4|nr:ferric reductase-like transmembrane domain-containing protein [Micromonospora sp. HUAS LYJ1]WKU07792.1 ferric reductase-like transmembrane domain-containing protein [Micromonospora sp. HUAS LYJ1]
MARAQQNEKAATVRTSTSSRGVRTTSKGTMALMVASALGLLWAGVEMTGNGTAMYAYGFFFTEFFAGVVALVSLSLTVMMGLLATDRLVLMIRHRVLLQSAHRATGILGVVGLVFHVITKIAIGRAGPTDAVVPFVGGRGLYVGLGTVAAFLMVSVLWTGIIRVRFAGVGPKWFWRSLHSLAYVSWPFALFHGLNAGRAAKSWVVLSYLACVLLVVLALLVRLSVYLGKRSREQQQAAALNKAMTGKGVDEGKSRTLLTGLGRKKEEEKESRSSWAETALAPSWNAPTGSARRRDPERFTVPVVPEPGTLREPVRGGRGRTIQETAPASSRERDLEPAARRRTAERDDRDERPRRRDEDVAPVSGARRSRYEEDVAPVSGGRRARYGEDVAPVSGSRRRDRDEDVAPVSGGRRSRYEEDIAPVSTGRRARRDDDDLAARYSAPPRRRSEEPEEPWDSPRRWEGSDRPVSAEPISAAPRSGSGRHSVEADVPEEPDYWRPPARYVADDIPVDDTPTLVDLASRRARKATGDSRSRRKGKANADAVDGAYWAGLRGEAK